MPLPQRDFVAVGLAAEFDIGPGKQGKDQAINIRLLLDDEVASGNYACIVVDEAGNWNGAHIVNPETLALMRTNQLAQGVGVSFPMWDMPGTVFGLGFALKEEVTGDEPAAALDEYHWGGMAGTHSWMAPRANLCGMCMTQRMPGFWHPFSHDFKKMAYRIAG